MTMPFTNGIYRANPTILRNNWCWLFTWTMNLSHCYRISCCCCCFAMSFSGIMWSKYVWYYLFGMEMVTIEFVWTDVGCNSYWASELFSLIQKSIPYMNTKQLPKRNIVLIFIHFKRIKIKSSQFLFPQKRCQCGAQSVQRDLFLNHRHYHNGIEEYNKLLWYRRRPTPLYALPIIKDTVCRQSTSILLVCDGHLLWPQLHTQWSHQSSVFLCTFLSLSVCAFAICNGKRKFFHKLNGVVVVWVREQSDMFELDDENKYPIKFSIQKLESTLFKGRILFMFWFYAARDLIYHSYSYQIHIYFINFHPILSICWPSYIHVCWFAILFVCIYLLARLLADVICIL